MLLEFTVYYHIWPVEVAIFQTLYVLVLLCIFVYIEDTLD